MKKIILIFISIASICIESTSANLPSGYVETRLATGLNPTDIAVAPDGRVFICEKNGKIRIVKNGTLLGTAFLQLPNVDTKNERGLQSIVFDPDFITAPYIYVYYTTTLTGSHNRVSRFTANGDVATVASEVPLLDLDNLGGGVHNGGQLVFMNDKTLIVAVGENGITSFSQDLGSMLGKIHRINRNGSIPTDNPYNSTLTGFSALTGKFRSIYALGFRNPFKANIQATTGKIFINDVGGDSREEISELLSGKNYGWPGIEGKITNQTPPTNYKDPIFDYARNEGCAITAGAFYNPTTTAFPSSIIGKYFYADYCNGYIRMIDPTNPVGSIGFATNISRPIDVEIDNATGSMYYLARAGLGGGSEQDNTSSSNGELWKVDYNGASNVSISVQPKGKLVSEGENTTFIVSANGSQPIYYQWQKNNANIMGATTNGLNLVNIAFADNGAAYKAVIRNATSTITSNIALLTVIPNLLPNATITSPMGSILYTAGTTITFSGIATDPEDGVLAASQFEWKIDLYHDAHSHPALDAVTGVKFGTYTIPTIDETSSNVWLRISLTVRDNLNATKTIHTDVFPLKVGITLNTTPAGLNLKLDGMEVTTPYTFTGVVGILRTIEPVISQVTANGNYTFSGWAQGGNTVQTIATPASETAYTAYFDFITTISGTVPGINTLPGVNTTPGVGTLPGTNTVTGLIDVKSSKSIDIFPNPTYDKVQIEGFPILSFQLYSIFGILLLEGKAAEEINLASFANGSYLLRLQLSDRTTVWKKVLKQ